MSDGGLSRRALLRLGAVTAGVGTAGCSGLFGSSGGDTGVYTQWLPSPGAIDAVDHYWFDYYDLESLAAERDTLGGEPTAFERTWEPVGMAWDDATAVVSVGPVDVVTAEFSRSGAVSDLQNAGYERGGEYKGYTLYGNAEAEKAVAVADGTLLVAVADGLGPADPAARLRAVVDAQSGDVTRYPAANEDMRQLVAELGTATRVSGTTMAVSDDAVARSGRFENLVAEGRRSAFDGGTVRETWVYLYDRPQDVDTDALKAYVRANDNASEGISEPFATVENISYEADGRKGIITGTRDASEYYA